MNKVTGSNTERPNRTLAYRRSRSLTVALIAVSAVLASLLVAAPASAAATLTVTPTAAMGSETVTVSGNLGQRLARPVQLQRKSGTTWVRITTGKSTTSGAVRFTYKTPTTIGYKSVLRVYAPRATIAGRVRTAIATPSRTVTTVAQTATISLPATADTGATFSVTGAFTPVRTGRVVDLQRLDGGVWTKVASKTQSSGGTVAFATSHPNAGAMQFRVLAAAYRGAPAKASAAKTITIADPTPVDTTPPPVPAGLNATPGDAKVTLSWTAVTAADLLGYRVYRATTQNGPWTQVTTTPTTATNREITGLTNGTQYWFTVTSVDNTGNESTKAVTASGTPIAPDTTGPSAPTGVLAAPGDGEVSLTWTAVVEPDPAVKYAVQKAPTASGPWTVAKTDITATSTSITGLINNTEIFLRVIGLDNAGNPSTPSTAVSATPKPYTGNNHCGTLATNETWGPGVHVLDCTVTVAAGRTLTVSPDAVVKAKRNFSLTVQGSLVANGTTDSPVVFTSIHDDSVGGDTNGNGTGSVPAINDWNGIDVLAGGSVTLNRAKVAYTSTDAINATQASVSVTNSNVSSSSGRGIALSSPSGTATVMGNTITNVSGQAIAVTSSSIDLTKLNGNSGSSNGGNGVFLQGTSTVSATLPWSGNLQPVVYGTCASDLRIAAGTTLTLNAGAVVKGQCSQATLEVAGSLVANGTTDSPVVFTSIHDDSVGGDTNGNGTGSVPAINDWNGIDVLAGGSVTLNRAKVAYTSTDAINATQASVSVTNSNVSSSSGRGIALSSPSGTATVMGNTITNVSGQAIAVTSSSIDLTKLNGNSGSSNGGNGVFLQGTSTVSATLPWSGNLQPVVYGTCASDLRIAAGTTLTLNAGAVVKGQCSQATLEVAGSLVANGTTDSPVVFTSIHDDSVGGDTNGNGTGSVPAINDWNGIDVLAGGSVTLNRAKVAYTSTDAINATQASVSVTNSNVSSSSGRGIALSSPSGTATVMGNTITNVSGQAIAVTSSSIDLTKLNGNSGSSNGGNGVFLQGTSTVSATLPWSGNLQPVVYGTCASDLRIAAGTTLTLNAGAVVKGQCSQATLEVAGSLVANGTTDSPVVFTSIHDDSVGGDTNGNGTGSVPAINDWNGIDVLAGGSVTLNRAKVAYTSTDAINATQASVSVTNSNVSSSSGRGIALSSTSGTATVMGNTITNVSGQAIAVTSSSIDLTKLNGNSGSSNGGNGVFLQGTSTVSATLPWSGNLQPVVYGTCASDLRIAAGTTLTLNAGAVVKGQCSQATLEVAGSLVANGTTDSPVVFTSIHDDSVGGDTNGNGTGSVPAINDWNGIEIASGGVATLNGTTLRYASTALSVADGGQAEIHGKVLNSTVGVYSNTYVDASNVDWGSPSGPSPIGGGTPVGGQGVDVLPWVGWTEPPLPALSTPGASPTSAASGGNPECKPVMFMGLRGSGQAPKDRADDDAYSNWQDGFGDEVWKIENGFTGFLDQNGRTSAGRKSIAVRYTAMHVPVWENVTAGFTLLSSFNAAFADIAYIKSIWQGVDRIEQYINEEIANCGNSQKYVLAGYSQGALSIHLYLTQRATTSVLSKIVAVGLLADPAKNQNPAEHVYSNGFVQTYAGDGLYAATGVYRKARLTGSGPLPSTITDRTISVCFDKDIVCAPGLGSFTNLTVHTNYTNGDVLTQMGRWLADTALDAGLPAEPQ